MNNDKIKPPIKSGWRGDINGFVENTEATRIEVSEITLRMDRTTAYALCNLLTDCAINESTSRLEKDQAESMRMLGAAIGRLIDHHAANNGGRDLVK